MDEHPEWRTSAYSNGLIPWLHSAPPGTQQQQPPPGPPQPQAHHVPAPQTVSSPHVVGVPYGGSGGGGGGGGGGDGYPAMPLAPRAPASSLNTVAAVLAAPLPLLGIQPTLATAGAGAGAYLDPAAQPQGQGQGAGAGPGAVAASEGPLVGRSEEEYMEAFLAELNSFLPMLDEAWLRGEVKRFAAGAALPPSTVTAMSGSLCAERGAARVRDVQLENAHNAALWGALAVGAMLCGGPSEEVCKYSRLAWVSMRECFDLNEPATVSAYLVVAVVSMMHGQMDRFRRYLAMAEGISRELGATLSAEVETVLRYMAVGHAPDVRLLERQWQDVSTMEMPSEPHLQMLHRLTRAKIYLIWNRHQSEWNMRQGLPRTPVDFDLVMPDFEGAQALLQQGRAAGACTGVIFIRGMIGVLTYARSPGTKAGEALDVMKPIINHLIRCPGALRFLPSYHVLHAVAMLLQATGEFATYEAVQRRFCSIQWSDLAVLPPLGVSLDGLCDHPICEAVGKMSAEARRRALAQQPPADGAAQAQEKPSLKRDRSAGAGACVRPSARLSCVCPRVWRGCLRGAAAAGPLTRTPNTQYTTNRGGGAGRGQYGGRHERALDGGT